MKYCFLKGFISKSRYPFVVSIALFAIISTCSPLETYAENMSVHERTFHKKLNRKKHVYRKQAVQKIEGQKKAEPEKKQESGMLPTNSITNVPINPALPAVEEKGAVTGLPVPRFLSLRADVVNMRTGPGMRYPILWIYHRRHMPVKLLREFDVWRLVQDVDGQKGWVQQATLSGDRTFIITGLPLTVIDDNIQIQGIAGPQIKSATHKHMDSSITEYVADIHSVEGNTPFVIMRSNPTDMAKPVAVLKSGVVGNIKECPTNSNWCKVKINAYIGWVPRTGFWGILPYEIIQSH